MTITSQKKAILIAMAFFFCINLSKTRAIEKSSEQASRSERTYFALENEHGAPFKKKLEVFDCSDKIFTVVELQDYPIEKYHLSVRWQDPYGTTREHTRYDFHIRESETRLWAWLKLSRATGAGMIQWLNPAAGLEEFIGEWQVTVKINDHTVATNTFTVSC
jgi:hypothetical protein